MYATADTVISAAAEMHNQTRFLSHDTATERYRHAVWAAQTRNTSSHLTHKVLVTLENELCSSMVTLSAPSVKLTMG